VSVKKNNQQQSSSSAPIISAQNLVFSRQNEQIIHDFSFEIFPGDYVGVIGPNGGGKTTLLRLLLGLLQPTQGKITILGGKPSDRAVRRQLGYVAQRGGHIDAHFPATVEEVIRSGRTALHGIMPWQTKHDEKAIQQAIHMMGVKKLLSRPIGNLSGGERQKVLLARALTSEPKILYLDEPVDGLDPASRDEFYGLLRTLNQDGLTIISVSHDVHSVVSEARSAICLKHQLVCHGDKACMLVGDELKDLFHKDRAELAKHHH